MKPSLNPSCPAGGDWYACTTGANFVGCCASSVSCSDEDDQVCPDDDLRPASFNPAAYGQYKDQGCNGAGEWYSCNATSPPFMGCCKTDACNANGCPSGQLDSAFINVGASDGYVVDSAISSLPSTARQPSSAIDGLVIVTVPDGTTIVEIQTSLFLSRPTFSTLASTTGTPTTEILSSKPTATPAGGLSSSSMTSALMAQPESHNLSAGTIAGVTIGSILGAALMGLVAIKILLIWRRWRMLEAGPHVITLPERPHLQDTNDLSPSSGTQAKPTSDDFVPSETDLGPLVVGSGIPAASGSPPQYSAELYASPVALPSMPENRTSPSVHPPGHHYSQWTPSPLIIPSALLAGSASRQNSAIVDSHEQRMPRANNRQTVPSTVAGTSYQRATDAGPRQTSTPTEPNGEASVAQTTYHGFDPDWNTPRRHAI